MFNFQGSFSALQHRNFRLFWTGQLISLMGSWMQTIAQGWLVLQLTNSVFSLGIINAMQYLPMLFFSLYIGVFIDRVAKRKLLILTQSTLMVLAFILGFLTFTERAQYYQIFILASLLGVANAFDMPTRQAFVIEMVGKNDLINAIALNSSIFNAARIIGPALAGLSIAHLGIAYSFLLNGLSFLPVITGLLMMDKVSESQWRAIEKGEVSKNIREVLRYIRSTPIIFFTILQIGFISLFAMNFNVLIPVYSQSVLVLSAEGYGFLMAAFGGGALVGGLFLAIKSQRVQLHKFLIIGGMSFCLFQVFLSFSKIYLFSLFLLFFTGFFMVLFSSSVNSILQINVSDHLRGRVMSVYAMAFAGVIPIGSVLSGSVASHWGVPIAIAFGSIIGIIILAVLTIWEK